MSAVASPPAHGPAITRSLGASVALTVLRCYRLAISPALGPCCRFTPSCSAYAVTAIERYGLVHGGWLALRRLLRCHPFHRGGHDPVPDRVRSVALPAADIPGSLARLERSEYPGAGRPLAHPRSRRSAA